MQKSTLQISMDQEALLYWKQLDVGVGYSPLNKGKVPKRSQLVYDVE
jgi:hypothetical protein